MSNAVGYKRPPTHTRFQSGRSGNPSGRPKRQPTFRAVLLAELAATTPGKDPRRAASKLHALVRTLVDTAIAGDARAQSLLIGALARMGDADENEVASLTADDQEILDAYMSSDVKGESSGTDTASPLDDDPVD